MKDDLELDEEEKLFVIEVRLVVNVMAAPWYEPDEYISKIQGTILGSVGSGSPTEFGMIELLKISYAEAMNDGIPLANVCDARSDFFNELYEAFFSNGEIRDDLDISPTWEEVLVVSAIALNEPYRTKETVITSIETVLKFFGARDLVIASLADGDDDVEAIELTLDEWRTLGFVALKGTPFVYRDPG